MPLRTTFAVSLLAAALALSACQTTAPRAATPAPTPAVVAPQAAPNDNLNAVLWVQRAAEYRATAQTVYSAATDKLEQALRDRTWNAIVPEERAGAPANLPPAVVVDVDETVLDNSPYQARLVRDGGEYNEATWDAWVREQKARAVTGAVAFARAAADRGITVLYISNRATHLDAPTLANLKAEGFPVKDASVFLGLGTYVEGCEQNGSEKNCRRQLAAHKYRVLLQVGDQLGDFVEVTANTPEARDALFRQYQSWFGERWFMLPNPTYGSWEPAVFNNAWNQPAATRRAAKRDALDVAR